MGEARNKRKTGMKAEKEQNATAASEISKTRRSVYLVGYVEERPWWPIQSPNNV